ncbi:recombinase family protein [Pararhizobium sp. PWRC1-1]
MGVDVLAFRLPGSILGRQFERELIAERTRAGVRRAKEQGKTLG